MKELEYKESGYMIKMIVSDLIKLTIFIVTTIITGLGPTGVHMLTANGQVRSLINSYLGPNKDVLKRLLAGQIRLEVMPQVIILFAFSEKRGVMYHFNLI
jgi:acyl CoA:acetate/3-ketoacid CoA transferase alpha subunit